MSNQVAHTARLAPYVEPHIERRRRGVRHPVHDFLFTYYAFRPGQLMRWRAPGPLEPGKRALAENTLRLLETTAGREPNFGCFGLHEWAMVYRADGARHPDPLRLGPAGTDEVVENHRLACTHFDAVRFFTPEARPLNLVDPRADDRADFEQPGCLHATLDLYKHAHRLVETVGSDLVADAFELAWEVRVVDMRAAPYDLSGLRLDPGDVAWTPIAIETAEGKREYAARQRQFSQRAAPIRDALITVLRESLRRPPS